MERLNLLISDLDNTLLGDEAALDEFLAWHARASDRCRLAYSSGRFIESIRQSIRATRLPEPDALIGGVGTEVFECAQQRQIATWPPASNRWNPVVVKRVCAAIGELTPQPDEFISFHKISYFGWDLDDDFLTTLRRQLSEAGQDVDVVYSSSRDLDVLPAGVDKGAAAAFLARHWNIPPQRVIVAGDSGNDAAMFRAGFRGIVVANALPELLALDGPHVYHARREFAAGVVEGLRYWRTEFS